MGYILTRIKDQVETLTDKRGASYDGGVYMKICAIHQNYIEGDVETTVELGIYENRDAAQENSTNTINPQFKQETKKVVADGMVTDLRFEIGLTDALDIDGAAQLDDNLAIPSDQQPTVSILSSAVYQAEMTRTQVYSDVTLRGIIESTLGITIQDVDPDV